MRWWLSWVPQTSSLPSPYTTRRWRMFLSAK
jgi:hypothetical protein